MGKFLTTDELESIQIYVAVIHQLIKQNGGQLVVDIASVPKGECILAKVENMVATLKIEKSGNA